MTRSRILNAPDRLTDPWLERYIEMYIYIYIVIRGPQEHQSLTGSSIYTLRPSVATYYHNRIYAYVVYGAVSAPKKFIETIHTIYRTDCLI